MPENLRGDLFWLTLYKLIFMKVFPVRMFYIHLGNIAIDSAVL